ncbi:MAG: hypothetical protein HQL64_09765 [Magnetococcales bacterium]|nr:hypothetical protein [Magnetococcales bacterium]
MTDPMYRHYRILPIQKIGFPLASDEVVLHQTFLHGCVYLLPFCFSLLALIFLHLVFRKVGHNFFFLPTLQELLQYDSPPLRLLPMARFSLTGLLFSVLAAVILFMRALWLRETSSLILTSRQLVYQTRAWHPKTQSWPLTEESTMRLEYHPWKIRCSATLIIRDRSGHETSIAFVEDAEILLKTINRIRQQNPSPTPA